MTDNLAPILEVIGGADLAVSNVSFDGGGGYDMFKPGGGKGIFIDVPEVRDGVVELRLSNVNITGTGSFGVHVSDCSLGDLCSEGGGGAGEGSPASISVELVDVVVDGAGFGRADADGVRVDDRGDGDIFFTATRSVFRNMGADGVELDEGDNGSVFVDVRSSRFEHNGDFCNAMQPPAPGGPCDDDGIKLTEDNDGDVQLSVDGSTINETLAISQKGNGDGSLRARGSAIHSLDLSAVDSI